MAEYLIQEEILVELADIIREKCEYYDMAVGFITKRDKIMKIKIPDGITTIKRNAFFNCTSLESVTIPNSVTSIGRNVFSNCYNLKSVTIPDSVTSGIDWYAFSDCTSLENVIIGKGVTSISFGAFSGCTSLTDIYLNPTTPPMLENTNAISTATTTIHVPIGSGDAYKSATNWSSFADIIVEDIEI